MFTVPPDIPLTSPDVPTVAKWVSLLLHVPPVAASLNIVVAPWQMKSSPVIEGGEGLTVAGIVTVQPEPSE